MQEEALRRVVDPLAELGLLGEGTGGNAIRGLRQVARAAKLGSRASTPREVLNSSLYRVLVCIGGVGCGAAG